MKASLSPTSCQNTLTSIQRSKSYSEVPREHCIIQNPNNVAIQKKKPPAVEIIDVDALDEQRSRPSHSTHTSFPRSQTVPNLAGDQNAVKSHEMYGNRRLSVPEAINNISMHSKVERRTQNASKPYPRPFIDGPRHAYVRPNLQNRIASQSEAAFISNNGHLRNTNSIHPFPSQAASTTVPSSMRTSYQIRPTAQQQRVPHPLRIQVPSAIGDNPNENIFHSQKLASQTSLKHIIPPQQSTVTAEDANNNVTTSPHSPSFYYNKFRLPVIRPTAVHSKQYPPSPTAPIRNTIPPSQQIPRSAPPRAVYLSNVPRAGIPRLNPGVLNASPREIPSNHTLPSHAGNVQLRHQYQTVVGSHSPKLVNHYPDKQQAVRHSPSPLKITQDEANRMSAQIRAQKKELENKINELISLEQRLHAETVRPAPVNPPIPPVGNYLTANNYATNNRGSANLAYAHSPKRKLVAAEVTNQATYRPLPKYSPNVEKRLKPSVAPVPQQQMPVTYNKLEESCGACNQRAYFVCSGCRKIWYCSKKCQVFIFFLRDTTQI